VYYYLLYYLAYPRFRPAVKSWLDKRKRFRTSLSFRSSITYTLHRDRQPTRFL